MRLRIPRSLIDARQIDLPPADGDGLVTVQLRLDGPRVAAIDADAASRPGEVARPAAPLAISCPSEPHAHLDKSYSAADVANPSGDMAAALAANLREIAQRSAAQVEQRSERALQQAWQHGLRAIRSHIDSGSGAASAASWDVLREQRRRWAGRVELQLVALVPIAFWLGPEAEPLAAQVAAAGGLLGGVLGPPFDHAGGDSQALHALLTLAERHGCGIDLHVDESETAPGLGVSRIAQVARERRSGVPITCSHASSMGLLEPRRCARLAEVMAAAGLAVVALPRTNLWLLGRRQDQTPCLRPQAPIRTLQRAGVAVAVGGDNVQDAWFPGGDYDPIDLLRLCVISSHLDPRQRQGLAPFTTAAARVMGLDWDGVLRPGAPADLLVLEASSWGDVLARPPARRVMRAGRWLAQQPPLQGLAP
ncbi:MAG: amidohydrolase family protein [Cyanobacteria bacterium K_DeepCast_35m_m2_023]|nr:amidohydrolase family protein [Cyanobacteria bacterium K_DeepCast_35m_m2_023]